jgi:TRAP-type transport system small permease protein
MIGHLRWTQLWLQRIERVLAALILVLILVTMVAQVAARYLFRAPFSWSEELCRFSLVWLTFLAAAYLMAQQRHITVDLWSHLLRHSPRRWADAAVHGIVTTTCLLLFFGSWPFVWYVHPVSSPALGIPRSFWYGGVSVGLLLMAFHSLVNGGMALLGVEESTRARDGEDQGLQLRWDGESAAANESGGQP